MQIKINSMITLDNQERYIVLNETSYENETYYLVMGMDEKKEVVESKVAIMKLVLKNEETYVERVTDSKLILTLTNLLKSQLKETI